MRRVETIMGIPVSLDVPAADEAALFTTAFDCLRAIDQRFSTYKPGSELSRYRAGELAASELSPVMQWVMASCEAYETLTDGYFSAYYDGLFDPTGFVKGWAIAEAGGVLRAQGVRNFSLNIGGDILNASDGTHDWRLGVQHPFDASALVTAFAWPNGAMATSGTYLQGAHIVSPDATLPKALRLVSATVVGQDIVAADVFATTCIAMGAERALAFIMGQPGYEALLITGHGQFCATPGFPELGTRAQNAQ